MSHLRRLSLDQKNVISETQHLREKTRSEAEITQDIKHLLKMRGVFFFKHWAGRFSRKGISDLLGIYEGRFLAIEIKRPGGKLTAEQAQFIQDINNFGGVGFVAFSAEDVDNYLARLGGKE